MAQPTASSTTSTTAPPTVSPTISPTALPTAAPTVVTGPYAEWYNAEVTLTSGTMYEVIEQIPHDAGAFT